MPLPALEHAVKRRPRKVAPQRVVGWLPRVQSHCGADANWRDPLPALAMLRRLPYHEGEIMAEPLQRTWLGWLLAAGCAALGCNALTGAADISLDGVGGSGGGAGADGGSTLGPPPVAGTGGGTLPPPPAGGGGGGPGPACGNSACEPGEDCVSCPADCEPCAPTCGNASCDAEETCVSCPTDCGACPPVCGNGACESGEDCANCAADCGACGPVCGNGLCEAGESCGGNCAQDCAGPGTYYVDPGQSIQDAMNLAQAYAHCLSPTWPNDDLQDALFGKVIINPGTHVLGSPLATRAHVRIEAYGAEVVRGAGSHIMYVDDNGGGGYNAPRYWTIVGGVWNANGGGGFSIVHTRKFVLWDMEIKNIGYKAHHLEINSSGGPYQAGLYNVVVHAVRMHGVATPHRIDDEAINIDYSWAGAAHNVAADGTVTNNVLIRDCEFYDVPRAVSSHHFQVDGGAPVAKASGITIQGGSFHDIDPSAAESGSNFGNDGAIRPYGWQNVLIEGVTFTNCATAVSVYAPSDYPQALGPLGSFVIQNNALVSCGRAVASGATVPLITVDSAAAGINFWDVQISGNAVSGNWVAGSQYFIAAWYTHNCTITGNHFDPANMSLSQEKAYNKYKAAGPSNTGTWNLSGNTVSDWSVDNS